MSGRVRSERGSAIVELPLVLGLLLLPFGLLILTLPTWVERQTAARDTAAEVARLVVVSGPVRPDVAALVRQQEVAYELPPGSLHLELVPDVAPGESLTVRVTVELPGGTLPVLGRLGARSWTAEHTERAPDYGAFSR